MGRPVVHFEVIGKDGEKLRNFYAELFDWTIDANNPVGYGIVVADSNQGPDGTTGIGGGIGVGPEGYEGHTTFYVAVPDVEEALAHAEQLGGTRVMGPEEPTPGTVVGMFLDPEGHAVGVVRDMM